MAAQPWTAVLALALAAAAGSVRAQPQTQPLPEPAPATPVPDEGPVYEVESCCDLCARASNPTVYNNPALDSYKMLVQGADGWLFRTADDLQTNFGPDDEGYRDLQRLNHAFKTRGVELVLVYPPTRALMHTDKLPQAIRARYPRDAARVSYSVTLERFRKLGITVPDFTTLLYAPGGEDFYFRGDYHWTPYGAQEAARLTAEAVRKLPSFRDIPKRKFVTQRVGMLGKTGAMQSAAEKICGEGYAKQYVDQFETVPDKSGSPFAPRGGGQPADITLVGTSNSEAPYNFAGFLSELLEAEVRTIAGGRGSLDTMMQFLLDPAFQLRPPKILIWEFGTYQKLSRQTTFRQLVPLVHNGCNNRPVVLSRRVTLSKGTGEALFNGGGEVLALKSKNFLLDLQFSDPDVSSFEGTVWYTNGSKETLNLREDPDVETRGRFVVELRSDGHRAERTFLSLDVKVPSRHRGVTVESKLCARHDAPAAARHSASRS